MSRNIKDIPDFLNNYEERKKTWEKMKSFFWFIFICSYIYLIVIHIHGYINSVDYEKELKEHISSDSIYLDSVRFRLESDFQEKLNQKLNEQLEEIKKHKRKVVVVPAETNSLENIPVKD